MNKKLCSNLIQAPHGIETITIHYGFTDCTIEKEIFDVNGHFIQESEDSYEYFIGGYSEKIDKDTIIIHFGKFI